MRIINQSPYDLRFSVHTVHREYTVASGETLYPAFPPAIDLVDADGGGMTISIVGASSGSAALLRPITTTNRSTAEDAKKAPTTDTTPAADELYTIEYREADAHISLLVRVRRTTWATQVLVMPWLVVENCTSHSLALRFLGSNKVLQIPSSHAQPISISSQARDTLDPMDTHVATTNLQEDFLLHQSAPSREVIPTAANGHVQKICSWPLRARNRDAVPSSVDAPPTGGCTTVISSATSDVVMVQISVVDVLSTPSDGILTPSSATEIDSDMAPAWQWSTPFNVNARLAHQPMCIPNSRGTSYPIVVSSTVTNGVVRVVYDFDPMPFVAITSNLLYPCEITLGAATTVLPEQCTIHMSLPQDDDTADLLNKKRRRMLHVTLVHDAVRLGRISIDIFALSSQTHVFATGVVMWSRALIDGPTVHIELSSTELPPVGSQHTSPKSSSMVLQSNTRLFASRIAFTAFAHRETPTRAPEHPAFSVAFDNVKFWQSMVPENDPRRSRGMLYRKELSIQGIQVGKFINVVLRLACPHAAPCGVLVRGECSVYCFVSVLLDTCSTELRMTLRVPWIRECSDSQKFTIAI